MSAAMVVAVCYLFLLNFPIYSATDSPKLQDVLLALKKMVSYYKDTHRDMNLDGIYGLRVLEGQLKVILDEYAIGSHQHLAPWELNVVKSIWEDAKNISEMSLPYLKKDDPEYYEKLKPLVDRPMTLAKDYRRIDLNLRWSRSLTKRTEKDDMFDEDFSDDCMGQLMGTGRNDGRRCVITNDCLESMLARGKMEYHVTHQLLYSMLAEQSGCKSNLDEFLAARGEPGGIEQIQKEFCSNHYLEVQQQILSVNGEIIPMYQDLFMEEEFVCPVLGFMEFLHIDWLKQILQWQKPNGCYGQMKASNFGRKYDIQGKTNYEYDNPGVVNDPNIVPNLHQRIRSDRNNLENTKLNNVQFQPQGVDAGAPQQDRINGLRNAAPVGMSNNVVVQQGIGVENKLHMKVTNISGNVLKPAAVFNNVVNVGAGQALPMHDLDIKANEGAGNVQFNQRQPHQGHFNVGNNLNPNQQIIQQNSVQPFRGQLDSNIKLNDGGQPVGQNNMGGLAPGPLVGVNNLAAGIGGPALITPANLREQQVDPLDDQKWQHPFDQQKPKDYQEERILLRKLLVEKDLGLGCLSHKTAVAAGALSQYLRFLINPGTQEYQQFVRIDGTNYMLHSVGGHDHQFGHNQPDIKNQVFIAQQEEIGANGALGQIKPPLDLMKKDAGGFNDDKDEGAGDVDEDLDQHDEEIEIPDQGLEQPDRNQIIDENDETIHVDPNEDKNDQIENYDEDEDYDDKDGNKDHGNYLDNKDHEDKNNEQNEDKYDDANYDENEKSREKLVAQNQAHINPKFQRHTDLNLQDGAKGRGDDQEYDQYLDEEELVNDDDKGNKLKLRDQNHGLRIPDLQHRKFDGRETNDDADQGYNYYVNKDENEEDEEKLVGLAQEGKHKNVYPQKKTAAETANLPHLTNAQNSNHIGKAYLLLLLTMFGLMYLMYRFVRQRRVIIKYHHRPYYR